MSARAIVLIGPMGAGKTSVGRRVARALEVPFADTDKLVVRDHGPIPELFAHHGEGYFRALERDAVAEALERGGVVALGGGAVLDTAFHHCPDVGKVLFQLFFAVQCQFVLHHQAGQ